VVLAGSTVTNTGPTIITGADLALSRGSAVTGFPPGTLTPRAVMHVTDPTAAQAQVDLTTAYIYTAGLPGGAVLPGNMIGLTFTPGLHKTSSPVMLSAGNATLDAQGDVNAVFIFQVASALTTIGGTHVLRNALKGTMTALLLFCEMALQVPDLQSGAEKQDAHRPRTGKGDSPEARRSGLMGFSATNRHGPPPLTRLKLQDFAHLRPLDEIPSRTSCLPLQ
jgi:Ice-binding-like